jgi:hypothetical protein
MVGNARFLEKIPAPGSRAAPIRETAPQALVDAPLLRPRSGTAEPSASGRVGIVHALQRQVGNQAVMRMLDVQRATADLREPSDEAIHAGAAAGVRTPSTSLPYLERIQASFGRHSIGDIQAHVSPPATRASRAMNAQAYASGNHVVFGARPDLRTAAHEATHIVQQRAGVQLAGGIGRVGDPYERHADDVAAAVVAGRSAEPLLKSFSSDEARQTFPIQTRRNLPVQRVLKIGSNTYTDVTQVRADFPPPIEWNEIYDGFIQEWIRDDVGFNNASDMLSRLKAKLIWTRHEEAENRQHLLTPEHWQNETGVYQGARYWEQIEERRRIEEKGKEKNKKKEKENQERTLTTLLDGNVARTLLTKQLPGAAQEGGKLKLYKTMTEEQGKKLMRWWDAGQKGELEEDIRNGLTVEQFYREHRTVMPVANHLGDRKQTEEYFNSNPTQEKMIFEITLKRGAHTLLFSPEYMAIMHAGDAPAAIHASAPKDNPYPRARNGEGNKTGYIGVKSEGGGKQFSLALGDADPTRLLFQLLVERITNITDEVKQARGLPKLESS